MLRGDAARRRLGAACAPEAGSARRGELFEIARARPVAAERGCQEGGATSRPSDAVIGARRRRGARALMSSDGSLGVASRGSRACMARVTCTESRDEDQNQTNAYRQKREKRSRIARSLGLGNARLRVCSSRIRGSLERRALGSSLDIASDTFSGRRRGRGRRQGSDVAERANGVCLVMGEVALVRALTVLRDEAGQPKVSRRAARNVRDIPVKSARSTHRRVRRGCSRSAP